MWDILEYELFFPLPVSFFISINKQGQLLFGSSLLLFFSEGSVCKFEFE